MKIKTYSNYLLEKVDDKKLLSSSDSNKMLNSSEEIIN